MVNATSDIGRPTNTPGPLFSTTMYSRGASGPEKALPTTSRDVYTMHTSDSVDVTRSEDRSRSSDSGNKTNAATAGRAAVGLAKNSAPARPLKSSSSTSAMTTTYDAHDPSV